MSKKRNRSASPKPGVQSRQPLSSLASTDSGAKREAEQSRTPTIGSAPFVRHGSPAGNKLSAQFQKGDENMNDAIEGSAPIPPADTDGDKQKQEQLSPEEAARRAALKKAKLDFETATRKAYEKRNADLSKVENSDVKIQAEYDAKTVEIAAILKDAETLEAAFKEAEKAHRTAQDDLAKAHDNLTAAKQAEGMAKEAAKHAENSHESAKAAYDPVAVQKAGINEDKVDGDAARLKKILDREKDELEAWREHIEAMHTQAVAEAQAVYDKVVTDNPEPK